MHRKCASTEPIIILMSQAQKECKLNSASRLLMSMKPVPITKIGGKN